MHQVEIFEVYGSLEGGPGQYWYRGRISIYFYHVPDKDDLDLRWDTFDDGGGILVTPPIKNLPIDLMENRKSS